METPEVRAFTLLIWESEGIDVYLIPNDDVGALAFSVLLASDNILIGQTLEDDQSENATTAVSLMLCSKYPPDGITKSILQKDVGWEDDWLGCLEKYKLQDTGPQIEGAWVTAIVRTGCIP